MQLDSLVAKSRFQHVVQLATLSVVIEVFPVTVMADVEAIFFLFKFLFELVPRIGGSLHSRNVPVDVG